MTITSKQASLAADALLDDACISQDMVTSVWRLAAELSRSGASHAELDQLIAAFMFGNARLRIRDAFGMLEPWECDQGPCPDCCVDCANATGGYCSQHIPLREYDR